MSQLLTALELNIGVLLQMEDEFFIQGKNFKLKISLVYESLDHLAPIVNTVSTKVGRVGLWWLM